MADFSFLRQRLDPTLRTAEYIVHEVRCTPPMKLIVAFAGAANIGYRDAITEMGIADAEEAPARPGRTPQERQRMIYETTRRNNERARKHDRIAYPEHIIKGWENVPGKDASGAFAWVPFSIEDARALLETGFSDIVFDRLRIFCSEAERFMDVTPIDVGHPGVESTAKNS